MAEESPAEPDFAIEPPVDGVKGFAAEAETG
jgi:hypothetical protein